MTPRPSILRCFLRGLRIPAATALGCLGSGFGQTSLVGNSPFSLKGAAGPGANAPAEAYELAGATVQGPDTSVCIYDRQAKHSQWIPVGGDVEGVHVVSYDPLSDTAVIVIAGSRKELAMRTAKVAAADHTPASRVAPAGRPQPAPSVPIAAAAPAATSNAAAEQREARMLVSDLLEIGIQQRKAYQEAKQRAATATPSPPEN
jgi:hypothetical protein